MARRPNWVDESGIAAPDRNPTLSVVMPCYNESAHLESTLREWLAVLKAEVQSFEIVVINDGSTDGCGRLLDSLRKENRELRVIHQLNSGHGRAVRRGYELARGQFVLQVDPSGRFETDDFMRMWRERSRYRLILAARSHRLDSWAKQIVPKALRRALRILFQVSLKDPNAPFRLIRRDWLVDVLGWLPQGGLGANVCLAALTAAESPDEILEIPVPFRFRPHGRTNMRLGAHFTLGTQLISELVSLKFRVTRRGGWLGARPALPPANA